MICADAVVGALVVRIEDAGRPFDPLQAPPAAAYDTLAAAELGGLGIPLIRRFASAMAYVRDGGLNRLTLRFDRAPGG